MSAIRRGLTSLTAVSLFLGTLTACSASIPDPAVDAEALAKALDAGDFSKITVTRATSEQANQAFDTAFGKLEGIKHSSKVLSVARDEEEEDGITTATAQIQTTWDVDSSDQDLEYTTTAVWEYSKGEESWNLRFSPEVLAPGLEKDQYLAATYTAAQRGGITDGAGKDIIADRPVVHLGIDKVHAQVPEWESSAKALAKLAGIDEDAYVAKVKAAGEKAWVEAITLRADERGKATDEALQEIPGARAIADEIPLAPSRSFARPVLGSVGQATAEVIEKSEGKIKAGDVVGLSGLQAQYNDTLSGTKGITVSQYSPEGNEIKELLSKKPVDGKDLQLSLDQKLQKKADELVQDADSVSAIVAIRPSDGAVLAAASGPESNGLNTALQGTYAPGSSFKVISVLSMIRNEGAAADTEVDCKPSVTVDGKEFKNYDHYPAAAEGKIKLSEAIAQSCNTVFIAQGEKIGGKKLAEAAAALGLVGEDGTGAGAVLGSVPDDSEGTEQAANMIGQGVVEGSPLGMATVAASVQAGKTVQPKLVLDPAPKAPAKPASELSGEESNELKKMMKQTIDHGTLKDLNDLPGSTIIGKSGTAEYDGERNAHAWAIVAQDDIAIAAFVEDGQGGAQSAGPLAKAMLKAAAKK